MKRKVLFIINPVSGVRDKNKTLNTIERHTCTRECEYEILFTQYPRHAFELGQKAVAENIDAVIISGGDGSVNEVASALVNTNVKLGIIPNGSGNGLARHLGIPTDPAKSLDIINRFTPRMIDTYSVNGHFGCNLAGLGYDAKVAHEFAKQKHRGFFSYVNSALKTFPRYKPLQYQITQNNTPEISRALFISIANSNQFGSGAVIAPGAQTDDGLLDICIVKPIPIWIAPWFAISMLRNRSDKTGYVKYIKVTRAIISADQPTELHIDGDPFPPVKIIEVEVNPLSLGVLV